MPSQIECDPVKLELEASAQTSLDELTSGEPMLRKNVSLARYCTMWRASFLAPYFPV